MSKLLFINYNISLEMVDAHRTLERQVDLLRRCISWARAAPDAEAP